MPELKISPLTAIRDLRGMRKLQGKYTDAIDAAIGALEYRIPQSGISRSKLNLSLNGNRKLTLDEYELICGALNVGTDLFLKPRLQKAN